MTPSRRVFCFACGPAVLPEPVLRQAQAELLGWGGRGFSMMETTHHTGAFVAVLDETEALLRTWLAAPDSCRVLFMHDGGHQQFAMGLRNLLDAKFPADDILSGHLPACRH